MTNILPPNPRVVLELNNFEAALIRKLRTISYGTLTAHKKRGELYKIDVMMSSVVDPLTGRDLENT